MVRPVGTEFWYAYPLGFNDQGWQKRFLYRVVAHDDTKQGLIERIEAMRMQKRQMTGIINFVQLNDRIVHDYQFGEWEEVDAN